MYFFFLSFFSPLAISLKQIYSLSLFLFLKFQLHSSFVLRFSILYFLWYSVTQGSAFLRVLHSIIRFLAAIELSWSSLYANLIWFIKSFINIKWPYSSANFQRLILTILVISCSTATGEDANATDWMKQRERVCASCHQSTAATKISQEEDEYAEISLLRGCRKLKKTENSPNDLRHSLFSEFQGIFCSCSNECIRAFDDQVIWVLPGGCCVSQGTPHKCRWPRAS